MKKNSLLKQAAAYPHIVWSILFIIAPLVFVAYYAFTDKNGNFTMDNIAQMAEPSYLEVFLRSLCFAFLATIICLIIAYPVAYFISKTKPKTQNEIAEMMGISRSYVSRIETKAVGKLAKEKKD